MNKSIIATIITIGALSSSTVIASDLIDTEKELFVEGGTKVTAKMYPVVETERQFLKHQDIAGVNKFNHKRVLTPTEGQEIVRMNRDTYYSFATINVSEGATVTLPEIPEGKYMTMMVVTEGHRIQAMQYGSGTYSLNTHEGEHVNIVIRLDAGFSVEEANAIQDKMIIEAGSNVPFSASQTYDRATFEQTERELKSKVPSILKRDGANALVGMFTDPADKSKELFVQEKYEVGAAIGWGGAQLQDNIYEVSGNFDNSKCYQATFEDPKNQAFLSITVYNGAGFMFNDHANISTETAKYNQDGTLTFSFGCGEDAVNNITTTDGNDTGKFNLGIRHYTPSKVVMDGFRILPFVKEVKQ
ncbi:DUF1254 domain-containing protein [Motilimonas pumila]|uniref:DUF1214 domain-containing protein n=1 Tax=Motilimonas pumila TaxID=2303987 RepID=A0A418YCD9_9GAMM|nr:DUF1254 domain-containing protein [Motilimonas pumila]RJG42135.1 DUF1214 domain-containing protein [Motilimonas pumila]